MEINLIKVLKRLRLGYCLFSIIKIRKYGTFSIYLHNLNIYKNCFIKYVDENNFWIKFLIDNIFSISFKYKVQNHKLDKK